MSEGAAPYTPEIVVANAPVDEVSTRRMDERMLAREIYVQTISRLMAAPPTIGRRWADLSEAELRAYDSCVYHACEIAARVAIEVESSR